MSISATRSSTRTSATPWRSTIRAASTASAAGSSTSSRTTAPSTMPTRATWSAAPGSSSTTPWRSAALAIRRYEEAVRHGLAFCATPTATFDRWLCLAARYRQRGARRHQPLLRSRLRRAGLRQGAGSRHRGSPCASRRDRAAHGAAFLVRGRWTLPRRDRRRLGQRLALSRPERQHAQLRGHARGVRGHR